jgi:hypothetical protein
MRIANPMLKSSGLQIRTSRELKERFQQLITTVSILPEKVKAARNFRAAFLFVQISKNLHL